MYPIFQVLGRECLIGPIVQLNHHHLEKLRKESKHPFVIKIPHCEQEEQNWKYVIVRLGNINNPNSLQKISPDSKPNGEAYYTVDDHFVTIFTHHFCHVVCSTCLPEWCQKSITVLLFGSFSPADNSDVTDVELRPYICSKLYNGDDFKMVSPSTLMPLTPFHRAE